MLGYTPNSWDDLSGDELQPWASIKHWAHLTDNEKAAAAVLGYTDIIWDNDSGAQPQPAATDKAWSKLSACANGEIALLLSLCVFALLL